MDNDIPGASEVPEELQQKQPKLIEEYIEKDDLEEIKKIFEQAPGKLGLKKAEFRSGVLGRLKIELSDDEFELLYTKMDFNKNEYISWHEFILYLVLELDSKTAESNKTVSIELPIVEEPNVVRSLHRSSVIHIVYSPSVRLDGTIDYDDGKYISMSKDGFVNFWSTDLKHLRSYRDKSLFSSLKSTWVTNFAYLPDLSIMVTSSTERELRFYDTMSKRFNLILVFIAMPFAVNHMHYKFTENLKEMSILICGDLGGNLRVMEFSKENRGPFKQNIGVDVNVRRWEQVVKGKLQDMKAFNITGIHTDWVKQVSYYSLLGSIISCSSSSNAMFIGDHHGFKNSYIFVLKRGTASAHFGSAFKAFIGISLAGIETFCMSEDTPMVVTGSLDCILRLWNPFTTTKPISIFRGHHSSIVKIFLQDRGRLLFSLDKDGIVKVWETSSQSCLQTYTGFSIHICGLKEFCAFYNERNHLFIIGGMNIATIFCRKLNDELRSDGRTHTWKVCAVLYNKLFNCLITCGMDSNIVIWNLWTNKTINCIRMAHWYFAMGVQTPLPITAATLDPPQQLLLTGSKDGSIKMWDFKSRLCLRNMTIGKDQEVTKLMWLTNRILAVGWNNRVVEFSDSLTAKATLGKAWELRHNDDIFAADYRPGQAIATSTYSGDLIFWKLETGQSYKRYNVTYPTGLFKLEYVRAKEEKKTDLESLTSKGSRGSSKGKKEKSIKTTTHTQKSFGMKDLVRNLLEEKPPPHTQRKLTVHCLLFLRSREMLPDQATLLTATENGIIQVWSHHPSGSFLQAFRAVHLENDYVSAMTSDESNEFLFTGSLLGYIKVWLMKNFCLTSGATAHVCMPLYRLQFPFLIKDRFWTRAKFAVRYQPEPLLLSSYRGHLSAILHFEYISECKLLLSGSADSTVRLWTLSGRYLGTLGQNKSWPNLKWGVDPEKINNLSEFRIPPELKRKGSYTTIKVLSGAPPLARKKYDDVVDYSITEIEKEFGIYGKPLPEPQVGHYHQFSPKLFTRKKVPPIDETMMNIPVFVHLKLTQWEPVEDLEISSAIQALKRRAMDKSGSQVELNES